MCCLRDEGSSLRGLVGRPVLGPIDLLGLLLHESGPLGVLGLYHRHNDSRAGFSMEVRDPDTSTGFIIFECKDGEDWETLNDEEEDTRNVKVEPSLHEDEPQEYGADREGALVIHEDLKT